MQQALLSRDVIGQAKGILMERLKITRKMLSISCDAARSI
jgi:AmiR/NasT family two-component response regulator